MRQDSSVHQLVYLYDTIAKAMDNKSQLQMVFCDITKAFDRVWHEGLLYKLKSIGFVGDLHLWLKDYLYARRQCVCVEGKYSTWSTIKNGVPQGSILGPLLFLVYINDLPTELNNGVTLLADDTTLFIDLDVKNKETKSGGLQTDLIALEKWANYWLVDFNPKKTECLTFKSSSTVTHSRPMTLMGSEIPERDHHKHLGLVLSETATWKTHITEMCTKAAKKVNMLRPLKNKLSRRSLHLLTNAFVMPSLEYGCVVWDNCTKALKTMIDKVYENALRLVTGAPNRSKREALYKETGAFKCQIRRDKQKLKLLHQMKYSHSREYLCELISNKASSLPGREHDILIPRARINIYQNSFVPCTTRLWNKLSPELKSTVSRNDFTKKLNLSPEFANKTINPFYLMGPRNMNIILANMRMECSDLNSDKKKRGIVEHSTCACGIPSETPNHYFLSCPLYKREREILKTDMGSCPKIKEILHGYSNNTLNSTLMSALTNYVNSTKRFTKANR